MGNETERGASLEMPGSQTGAGASAVAAAQAGLDPDERPVPDYPNVLADAVETCQGAARSAGCSATPASAWPSWAGCTTWLLSARNVCRGAGSASALR